ncbi:TPA: hypothetical protein ACH3X1_003244 [Trebouxia sp. C0004]
MDSTDQKAFRQLQQCAHKLYAQSQLSGWAVKSGKQGVYCLHEGSSLAFHTLGAARLAVQALSQIVQSGITGTDDVAEEDDDANEEGAEVVSLCSCLDGVVGQLQKPMNTLQSYQRQPQEYAETSWAVCNKIEDMKDLDKQKILKGDVDTDLLAIGIGE